MTERPRSPRPSGRRASAAKAEHSETARQVVHMAMGAFALLLRWLTWWQALALAAAALAFNLVVLPRIGGALYRPGDRERGLHGILYYPLAVLLLLVAFPTRPDIAAAAWGILAIGDGIATLAGRAIGGPTWPWNREKTLSGSAAFAIGGAAAGVAMAWWCRPAVVPPPAPLFAFVAPVVAALLAALVETIPVRLDDNLSVAATAAAAMWLASLASLDRIAIALPVIAARLPAALALNGLVAFAGYRARTVALSGALGGVAIGITIFSSLGWRGWVLLLVTFVAATVASKLGLKRKRLLGIAEDRGGRRGAGNAIANTGVAAIASLVALLGTSTDAAQLAFAAALTAGGSDTIASEIGKAWGRTTWSITSLTPVPPGTSGAMSLEGTVAGIVGALGLGTVAVWLGLVPSASLLAIVIGATAGSLLESWLGATLEAPGILNNDMLNFINTAAAALVTLGLASWGG
jgi:uncharacterized protein (TIGR00297 family)